MVEVKYEKDYFTKTAYPNGYNDPMPMHAQRVDNIIRLTHPKSVLDLGCAYGYIVKRLRDRGIEAFGMDISEWAGQQAAKIVPGGYTKHDMRSFPYPYTDNEFDVVYCEGVLEHIDEKYIWEVRGEIERIGKSSVIAVTFDTEKTEGHICNHDRQWWKDWLPSNSWLYLGDGSSDREDNWFHNDYYSIYDSPAYWNGTLGYRRPGYDDFLQNTLKEIAIILTHSKSVLDIGCAYGFTVGRLRALGYEAQGFDVSKLAISRAEKDCKPFLRQGTVWDMPYYKDKEFDLVFSSGMLEHIPAEKMDKAISEMVRIGKYGLIGVACTDDPSTVVGADASHEVLMTQKEWQAKFPDTFRIISDSTTSWRKIATLETYRLVSNVRFVSDSTT